VRSSPGGQPDRAFPTAHEDWDRRWRDPDERAGWEEPDQHVQDLVTELKRRSAKDALNLGCGVGRHALFLASEGFDATGTDASSLGIEQARSSTLRRGLAITFQVEDFLDLSFPDRSFDYVIAWNVVYHGDGTIARRVLDQVRRVLRPGSLPGNDALVAQHRLRRRQ
jgi:SAM-dependent methyltransferase